MQPETRYAGLGSSRIAYQVIGKGPIDLVFTSGSFGHVDLIWEDPVAALFLRRLASFSRLIRFDRLGTSASDPLPPGALPPWESYGDELTAVLDEVGSERVVVMASLDAGPMALLFAASRPERTRALILANTTARYVAATDYPIGIPREAADSIMERIDQLWGTEEIAALQTPSRANDERFRRWYAKYVRAMGGPAAVRSFLGALFEMDARPVLPSISVPTLVIHRTSYALLPIAHGRYLAEHIDGARFIEIPGADGGMMGEHQGLVLDAVEEFVTGVRPSAESSRQLATVLFTDIVASTNRATQLGDRRWREVLDVHDDIADRLVHGHEGRLVKTTGDGIMAIFDGPGRAVRCAVALRDDLRLVGLEIRTGIHTGEVEIRGDDVGGMAVHIAARVMAGAEQGEVLVTGTVRDLVVGSDLALVDAGVRTLRGVEGDWRVFSVA